MPFSFFGEHLPPRSAQLVIVLGFLEGTWTLVEGFQRLIIGRELLIAGHAGPWAAWGVAAAVLGALWMIAGNLYLFQNRAGAWRAMVVLIVVSSLGAGWAGILLAAQLGLLLLPATRRGLAPAARAT